MRISDWSSDVCSSDLKSGNARIRLLDVALRVIREKGYHATTVDELCAAAGVTKGAFFHHFKSKEDVAVQAARHWSEVTGALFASAPYHRSEEHTSELQSLMRISYAVFCLKKKKNHQLKPTIQISHS